MGQELIEVLRCDWCEREERQPAPFWRRVDFRAEITTLDQDTEDRYFCSLMCLSDWVEWRGSLEDDRPVE